VISRQSLEADVPLKSILIRNLKGEPEHEGLSKYEENATSRPSLLSDESRPNSSIRRRSPTGKRKVKKNTTFGSPQEKKPVGTGPEDLHRSYFDERLIVRDKLADFLRSMK
jgi:hypothetical protein